jgi:amino acid adenylation domain-containing protein
MEQNNVFTDSDIMRETVEYWKDNWCKLSNVQLPAESMNKLNINSNRGENSLNIQKDIYTKINTFSIDKKIPIALIGLASYLALLYRYGNQEEVFLGIQFTYSYRSTGFRLKEAANNSLYLMKTVINATDSFSELLKRVNNIICSKDKRLISFSKLVKEANIDEDSIRKQIKVMYNYIGTNDNVSVPGCMEKENHMDSAICLIINDTDEDIVFTLNYNTDLFGDAIALRILEHLQNIIIEALTDYDKKICKMSILTKNEECQLLYNWNNCKVNYSIDECIHWLFEKQAIRHPNNIAVLYEDKSITYSELDKYSCAIAHQLTAQGLKIETMVGIYMERSIELVIALIGIMRAGGVCVTLDPSYPDDRLSYMISDANLSLVFTQEKFGGSIERYGCKSIVLNSDFKCYLINSIDISAHMPDPENLAFVFYTSGSTGTPKGVMLSHKACCRSILWEKSNYRLDENLRFVFKSSISFDNLLREVFLPLICGGEIVIACPEKHKDNSYITRLIESKQATAANFTSSLLDIYISGKDIKTNSCLEHVFNGGEALSTDTCERFFNVLPSVALHNIYGATEALTVTYFDWHKDYKQPVIPIGKPTDMKVYVLDKHLNMCPIGVQGELCIGGDGIARGYINLPELTEQKFIPNPFSSDARSFVYRTGDLVRYWQNGNVEWLGRVDNQVKLGGIRVELGEIEELLNMHPSVKKAIVLVNEDRSGNKNLNAFVVLNNSSEITIQDLKKFLKAKLPEHMVPSTFRVLQEFPLNSNGKIDSSLLLNQFSGRPKLDCPFVPPENNVQSRLKALWEEVLTIPHIGILDNFYELGGNSLSAIRLVVNIENDFNIEVDFDTLFKEATIEKMANALSDFK